MLPFFRLCAPSRAAVRCLTSFVICVAALACGGDRVSAPIRGKIAIASGDAQRGVPGQQLDLPIIVVVRDARGTPASDVAVTWFAEDGGRIDPAQGITDAEGRATATWILGGTRELHHGRAEADGYAPVEFTATTPDDNELPLDIIQPLTLATYDKSNQTVHPDYVAAGPEWTHATNYLFITPYPNGNAVFENPSVYQSSDWLHWSAPAGVINPIMAPPEGYYSDPDALYVPERNELWLYFRQVTDENIIRLTTSSDGEQWSAPVVVAHAANHQIISPTVVRRAPDDWLMWAVNGNAGCTGTSTTIELRRSTNGVIWSSPQRVDLSQGTLYPWHIDVEWIPSRGQFWAMYNVKTAGTCTTAAVYLATSSDGVHWTTHPSPVLARGVIPELQDVIYRSTFAYDDASQSVTIWYSGARYENGTYIWRSAIQRRRVADLLATIDAPPKAAASLERVLPQFRNFP